MIKSVVVFISVSIVFLACAMRVLYPDLRDLVFIPFALLKLTYTYKISKTRPIEWTRVPSMSADKINKPNVVVILVDDLGLNDISFYGGGFQNVSTPNIDSIGIDGVSYTKAYAGCATCAPSRAALMTGRYPTKIGFEFTPTGSTWGPYIFGNLINIGDLKSIYHDERAATFNTSHTALPVDEITIPESLKKAGYRSLHLGKWHLGNSLSPSSPFNKGFDDALTQFSGTYHMAENDPNAVNCKLDDPMDKFVWAGMVYSSRFNEGSTFEPDGHVTDYLSREAAAAISVNKDHPFFMYLSFTAMHTPLQALKSDYDSLTHIHDHCARVYAAMLVALDRGVGTVLNALKENGLTNNTVVVFTSDNGAPGYIGLRDLNYPLRGFKGTFFEGGIRVPMLVKYPGHIAPGTEVQEMVSHVDLYPTIMALAGVETTHDIDGIDILPYAMNQVDAKGSTSKSVNEQHDEQALKRHKTLFWRSDHYMTLRKGRYKVKRSGNPKKVWLFDLDMDPKEKVNLADSPEYAEIVRVMLQELDEENSKQSAPNWPCLSESPILVDKLSFDPYNPGDEYVYWPN